MKKGLLKKTFVGLLVACMACAVTACGENTEQNSGNNTSSTIQESQVSTDTQTSEQQSSVDDLGLSGLTLKLDSITYTLPCDFSEFEKNGWQLTEVDISDSSNTLESHKSSEMYQIVKADGAYDFAGIKISFINTEESENQMTDCKVGGIVIARKHSSYDLEEPFVEFPNGLSLDQPLTVDDITALYGEGDSCEEGYYQDIDSGDLLKYQELNYEEREGDYLRIINFLILEDDYITEERINEYYMCYEYEPE